MDYSQQSSEQLVAALAGTDSAERIKVREALVQMGSAAVAPLVNALGDSQQHVRWEAAKALAAIADPSSAEKLVGTLNDKDTDVRWVAGEALIALGKKALKPLLTILLKKHDSYELYKAAHHVLHDIAKNSEFVSVVQPVLDALTQSEPAIAVPVAAQNALSSLTD